MKRRKRFGAPIALALAASGCATPTTTVIINDSGRVETSDKAIHIRRETEQRENQRQSPQQPQSKE